MLSKLPLQLFQYFKNTRTSLCILNCQRVYLVKLFPVRMRVLAASFRSVLINTAIVIRSQKRARHRPEYIVFILVDMQMACYHFVRLDTQCLCNPFDVAVGNTRAQRTATVTAFQAVYRVEHLFVDGMNRIIQYP